MSDSEQIVIQKVSNTVSTTNSENVESKTAAVPEINDEETEDEIDDKLEYEDVIVESAENANSTCSSDTEMNDDDDDENNELSNSTSSTPSTPESCSSSSSSSDTGSSRDGAGSVTPKPSDDQNETISDTTPISEAIIAPISVITPVTIVQTKLSEHKLVYVKILPPSTTIATSTSSAVATSTRKTALTPTTQPTVIICPKTTSDRTFPSTPPPLVEITQPEITSSVLTATESSDLNASNVQEEDEENTSVQNDEILVAPSSQNKMSRDLKQLKKTINESKMLSEMINDSGNTRPRKSRKDRDFDESREFGRRTRSRSKSLSRSRGMDSKSPSDMYDSENRVRRNMRSQNIDDSSDFGRTTRSRSKSLSRSRGIDSKSPSDMYDSENRVRRNMRSQNIEFAQKQQKFLNRIQSHQDSDGFNSDGESIDSSVGVKACDDRKRKFKKPVKEIHPPPKVGWDKFCWRCHRDGVMIPCATCVRSYHLKCAKLTNIKENWHCQECTTIESAEKVKNGVHAKINSEELSVLLTFALNRMKQLNGNGLPEFMSSINRSKYPNYDEYVVNPVDLGQLQTNIINKKYESTDAYLADAQWLFHNAFVYFSDIPKLTSLARLIFKICKQEMYEIETCHECYYNANTKTDWFTEVCSKPHILLWAKLKSFPYWPAKAMVINSAQLVSVRFFGDHDRAWVPIKDCYLYSGKDRDPNTFTKNKRNNIAESIKEVDLHISKIRARFGNFNLATMRAPFDPVKLDAQLRQMIPDFDKIEFTTKIDPDAALTNCTKSKLTYKIIKTADNNLSISPVSGLKFNLNGDDSMSSISTTSTPIKKDEPTHEPSSKESPCKIKLINTLKSPVKEAVPTKELILNNSELSPPVSNKITIERKNFDGGQKMYQILRRKSTVPDLTQTDSAPKADESDTKIDMSKLKRVIIKRKSNNWNMLTIPLTKKTRSGSGDSKQDCDENKEEPPAEEVPEANVEDASKKLDKKCHQKRKKSMDEKQIILKIAKTSTHVILNNGKSEKEDIKEDAIKKPETTKTSPRRSVDKTKETNAEPIDAELNPMNERLKAPEVDTKNLVNYTRRKSQAANKILDEKKLPSDDIPSAEAVEKVNTKKTDNTNSTDINNTTPDVDPLILPDEIKTEIPDPLEFEVPKEPPITRVLRSQSKSNEKGHNTSANTIVVTSEKDSSNKKVNSSDQSPVKIISAENSMCDNIVIKSEPVSEDDDVVESSKTNESKIKPPNIHIPSRGFVTVRDINKMKNAVQATKIPNPVSQLSIGINKKKGPTCLMPEDYKQIKIKIASSKNQRARKSFPTPKCLSSGSLQIVPIQSKTNSGNSTEIAPNSNISSTNPPALNIFQNKKNINSMVYIPIENNNLNRPIIDPNEFLRGSSAIPVPPLVTVSSNPVVFTSPHAVTVQPISVATSNSFPPVNNFPQATTLIATNVTTSTTQSIPPPAHHIMTGFVTTNLASAITNTISRGPPKLIAKPTGPLRSDGESSFTPEAGPLSRKLIDNAHKMTDFFRSIIEDTIGDLSNAGSLEARIQILEMDLETAKHTHQQELTELKHNTDRILCEMKTSIENEKTRLCNEIRKQCEQERLRVIEETKRKQWCVNCSKEAQFYCCWNTSYCDYPCQQQHWPRHMASCAQNEANHDVNGGMKAHHLTKVCSKDRNINKGSVPPRILNSNIRPTNTAAPPPRTVPLQRLVPITNAAAGSPCYTIVHNRQGQWEMVSSGNKLMGGATGQQQPQGANIIVAGNPPTIIPASSQIMDPIVIAPDSFVISQQNIVVSKSN